MITYADFDRSLRRWLADGDERAPAWYVEAALRDIAETQQRRSRLPDLPLRRSNKRARRSLAAGLLVGMVVIATLVAIAVGGRPDPSPSPSPRETPPSFGIVSTLRAAGDESNEIRLSVPSKWQEVKRAPEFDFGGVVQFSGTEPAGDMSLSFGRPFEATICTPACLSVGSPNFIPYSPTEVLDALETRIAHERPDATWVRLADDAIADVEDGRRLDVVARELSGTVWHQVFVIGVHSRGVLAVTWNQREDTYEAVLFDAVLASIRLTPVEDYPSGTTMVAYDRAGDGYSLTLPDSWVFGQQPPLDYLPASNVRWFGAGFRRGDGMAVVSLGDPDGSIRICDPNCRLIPSAASLDDLEAAVRSGGKASATSVATLDGEEARSIEGPGQRWVVAVHLSRPVVLWFDLLDSAVEPSIVDEIVASFRFAERPIAPQSVFTAPDRTVEIALPDAWHPASDPKSVMKLSSGSDLLWVLRGDGSGLIDPCIEIESPWEDCSGTRVTTLDALARAVAPVSPPAACRINCDGPVTWTRDNVIVGGEPGFITVAEARPRRGPEWVAYVGTIHNGSPVVIRVWKQSSQGSEWLDEIISGFRFLD